MGHELPDGTVIPSNLHVSEVGQELAGMFNNFRLFVGQIVAVYPIDSATNRSKKFVEYDVLVADGQVTLSRYRNCRCLDSYGDENNFQEKVYRPVTEGKRGKKNDTEGPAYRNGAVVVVGCLSGRKESAVIISGMQHPATKSEKPTNSVPKFQPAGSSKSRDSQMQSLPQQTAGAKIEDGQRVLGEFQGLRWNINKDGELTIIYQGAKDGRGNLTASATQPTILKINKEGEVIILDNLDQEIKISRKDKKIFISSGNTDPDFIEIDRTKKNITVDMGNDEIHNIDHDRVVTIKNNQTENIAGESTTKIGKNKRTQIGASREDKVSKDHITTIGGKMDTSAGKSAKIKAPLVELTNGSTSSNDGCITGQSVDPFTGLPHIDFSGVVRAKK